MPVPLGRVASTRGATPLPDPLQGLARSKYKVTFSRSQLNMFAGPPGAGKTTTALIMALRMGVPCLYISADSDETTMAARAASAITGHSTTAVKQAQAAGLFYEEYGAALKRVQIRFVFDPSEPSLGDIANAVAAYVDVFGQAPALIVIDNLMNMSHDEGSSGNEWQGMRSTMKSLHWLARRTKACLWVLHHTSEQSDKYITRAPPRGEIQGKLAQLPEVILTLANDQITGEFWIAVVKNRHGPSDPLAKEPLRMVMDFTCNNLIDQPLSTGVVIKHAAYS